MTLVQKILNKRSFLVFLLLSGLLVQIAFILVAGDRQLEHEWGILVHNLLKSNEYAYYSFNGQNLPSAYMPPLYAYFLLFIITLLKGWQDGNPPQVFESTIIIIEIIQALLSLITAYFIYRIARTIDSRKTVAYLAVAFYMFFPITIAQAGQISSINLYQPLMIALLFHVHRLYQKYTTSRLILISVLMGLSLLARGESTIYFLLILVLINFIKKFNIKGSIIFILCTFLIVFPYAYRNYTVFGQVTPLTISGGLNLWRGHNRFATSDGYPFPDIRNPELENKVNSLPKDNLYEVSRDRLFKEDALNNIQANPGRSIYLAFDKFIALWVHEFDISYPYKFNDLPLYYLWWLFYIVLLIVGLYKNLRNFKSQAVLIGYLVSVTAIHMVFFVLPRYRLHLLPVISIYAAIGLFYLVQRGLKLPFRAAKS